MFVRLSQSYTSMTCCAQGLHKKATQLLQDLYRGVDAFQLPVIPHNNHVEDVPPGELMHNAFGTPQQAACMHAPSRLKHILCCQCYVARCYLDLRATAMHCSIIT